MNLFKFLYEEISKSVFIGCHFEFIGKNCEFQKVDIVHFLNLLLSIFLTIPEKKYPFNPTSFVPINLSVPCRRFNKKMLKKLKKLQLHRRAQQ